jgi:hypothetical protein
LTRASVKSVNAGEVYDEAPPPGTAIVRPLRHVRAVRERYLCRFADTTEAAMSRSARAWSWALGETTLSPVTDHQTAVPPMRPDIEVEIAAADERRLRGDRENRADAAATILRWLIGDDDHVPVRGENPGELVGGFGDVVRTPGHIASILALAGDGQRRAAAKSTDIDTDPASRQFAQQDADYLDGVVATLEWALGQRAEAPITRGQPREPTTRNLKAERVHANDVIEQARHPWMANRRQAPRYGEGVKLTITWLLGDSTISPADTGGQGPFRPTSHRHQLG